VAVADLGNGHPDIVTANVGSNDVSVLLGDGHDSFQPARNFAVGDTPFSVAVADLGNGHPDIVTANVGSNDVSVLLGDGHGSFQTHLDFHFGSEPQSICVADVNGDGIPDIVTANSTGNSVTVLLGSGNGSFVPIGLFVPVPPIPALLAEGVRVDATSLPPLPIPLQPPSVALEALTSATTSGSGQGISESSGRQEPNFDPLPAWLSGQPERIDLPTEREILAGMDIARSLLKWSRPQANLVPQPQDTVVAIGALLAVDPDDGAARKNEVGKAGARDAMDLRPYLVSPIEDTLLGPPIAHRRNAIPVPGLGRAHRDAIDAVLQRWKKEADRADLSPTQSAALVLSLFVSVLGLPYCWPYPHAAARRNREKCLDLQVTTEARNATSPLCR
jgi:hypothetical protein